MSEKHPSWTRTRVGRNRVHWVAYDGRSDGGERRVIDQGYAASLAEADSAARSALAAAGMYQARRVSTGSGLSARGDRDRARPTVRPREYLYSRFLADEDDEPFIAAHLIRKKTPRRVYATRRSCGPDQLGTDDENWGEDERTIALDRARLERDGSVYTRSHARSEFYTTLEAAVGETAGRDRSSFGILGLRSPCTLEDIKAAYRRRSLEAHPDRGGGPGDFQSVEVAYRRLLREAQGPEA